ncbi:MAG: hypothetical protein QNJ97_01065 [Myxococcota bacterium]|nr:hypothetical protein [Myxococcota bacterium]
MEEPSCKSCMYWMQNPETQTSTSWTNPDGQTNIGWCRRYPPHVLWIDSPNMPTQAMKPDVHSFMPAVHADLWCGEYKFKGSGKSKTKAKGKGQKS